MNTDWNPESYLRFNQERTQPAIDLLKRIEMDTPMIKSTGLRPYIDEIRSNEQKAEFENQVLHNLHEIYQRQRDGRVLFPFKRLFLIAGKG